VSQPSGPKQPKTPRRVVGLVAIVLAVAVVGLVVASGSGSSGPARTEADRGQVARGEAAREEAAREEAAREKGTSRAGAQAAGPQGAVSQAWSAQHDTSPPLSSLPPKSPPRGNRIGPDGELEEGKVRKDILPHPAGGAPDPAAQTAGSGPSTSALITGSGFDGPGNGVSTVRYAPPDPNSAVGPTYIVTVVNTDLVVQNKSGAIVYGPVGTSTIWSGFAGACGSTNDGDAVVRYDRAAGRWVITQFANAASSSGPYYECMAVSTTGDPTGSWNRYAYSFANFPDYPKLSVWSDAYYISYNLFAPAGGWVGPQVCAMDRAAMLAGSAASQQCFSASASYGGLLVADLDGPTSPPTGQGVPIIGITGSSASALATWNLKVDWATPGNSVLSGPTALTVGAFTPACNGGACIAQPNTTNPLDSLADRLMYRFAYRNFGDHESMVVSHSVTSGGSNGVRWYEIRRSNGVLSVYQQGTYVPDATSRWMPSVAMDKVGNIGIGYSASSSSVKPGLRATGRLVGDTLGQMTQPEVTLVAGLGSQTGNLQRWGDYQSMNVDPADDCTLWFTGEYLPADGSFNWRTRVASFQLPGCSGPVVPDFGMTASPASASISPGASAVSTIATSTAQGSAQSVALSASGLPAGASATFNPASVTSGGSSTLTITTTAGTPAGYYPVTITGTGSSATHTASFTMTVAQPDFTIAVSPTSTALGRSSSVAVQVSTVAIGTAQTVALKATGLPTGVTATFTPASVTAGSSAQLTLTANANAALGPASVTITGTSPAATHTAALAAKVLTSNPVLNPGFEKGTGTTSAPVPNWTKTGTASVVNTTPHTGAYSARAGSTARTNGDSTIVQSFTAPTGATQLSFWYRTSCPDQLQFDWSTATLKDTTTNVSSIILPKTCTNTGIWNQVSTVVVAGHKYTLTLTSHDDNYAVDPTYTQFDDIVVG